VWGKIEKAFNPLRSRGRNGEGDITFSKKINDVGWLNSPNPLLSRKGYSTRWPSHGSGQAMTICATRIYEDATTNRQSPSIQRNLYRSARPRH
jgi:hypothetical protein